MPQEKKILSRSEREIAIKNKAGWVITVLAALLAVNTYIANSLSSRILTDTLKANDTYSFYQAKSIKQEIAENALEVAISHKDLKAADSLKEKIKHYESDPKTNEGRKELLDAAKKIEADRDVAKLRSPWLTFSGSALQLAIVLLSASILAVSMGMFWGSIGIGIIALVLMSQGIWLWF